LAQVSQTRESMASGQRDAGNALRALFSTGSGTWVERAGSAPASPVSRGWSHGSKTSSRVEPAMQPHDSQKLCARDFSSQLPAPVAVASRGSSPDDLTLAELSLSESEPSTSHSPLRRNATSSTGKSSAAKTTPGPREEALQRGRRRPDSRSSRHDTLLAPSFRWLQALPRDVQRNMRLCTSPHAARDAMAEALGVAQRPVVVPDNLVEDLRRHTQAEQQRVLDAEEELEKQALVHETELRALQEDHHRICRKDKLQLLARCAPHRAASMEALLCEAHPTLAPLGTALALGKPRRGETLPAIADERSHHFSKSRGGSNSRSPSPSALSEQSASCLTSHRSVH